MSADFSAIQPPLFPDPLDGGCAPTGVCSHWMDGAPCGAVASHHVIWDSDMRNSSHCPEHAAETRRRWVYLGLHVYTSDCAASNSGGALWLPADDRCVIDEISVSVAEAATSKEA